MGKTTVNARHPMALQAEMMAHPDFRPAPTTPEPPAPTPPPPLATAAAPVVAPPPPTLTLKEKLDTLPDEELLLLAEDNDLEATADRDILIAALVEAEVTL